MKKPKLKLQLLYEEPVELNPKKIKKSDDFKTMGLDILDKEKNNFTMEIEDQIDVNFKWKKKKADIDLDFLKKQSELTKGLENWIQRDKAYEAARDHTFVVDVKGESSAWDTKIEKVRSLFLASCLGIYTESPLAVHIPQTGLVIPIEDFHTFILGNMGDLLLASGWFNIILDEKSDDITVYTKGVAALGERDIELTMPKSEWEHAHNFVRNIAVYSLSTKLRKGDTTVDLNDKPYTIQRKYSDYLDYGVLELMKG